MYVLNKEAHYALRALAMLVSVAVLLWTLGITLTSQLARADAANVTSFNDMLSDSDLGVASNHLLMFTMPNGAMTTQTFTLTFNSFTVPSPFDFTDVDVSIGSSSVTLAGTAASNTWGVATTSSSITFTTSTSSGQISVASSSIITVKIGTNAVFQTTGVRRLVNPATANSYQIDLAGTVQDSGHTRVAIIDNVDVTATVNTSFTFTVTGLATSTTVNGTSTTRTSTATAIPFGTLTNGVITTLAQRLNVTTNAAQGFMVTVFQDHNLLSSTGADIDGFIDGAYTNTPAAWVTPTNNIANENTWGHWGLTSTDDLNTNEFSSNKWVAASTTPRQIFGHTGPSDGTTNNIGSSTVAYQAQITSLQEAGDDYRATLTYIATPTF